MALPRPNDKVVEAWLKSKAMAAGLSPRLRIEKRLDSQDYIIYGRDRQGERKVLRISEWEAAELAHKTPHELEMETHYHLKKAEHEMRHDMEREMAAAWNNSPTYNTWNTATSTSATTYTDYRKTYSVYPQDMARASDNPMKERSAPRVHKDFRAELQYELHNYLRGALE